MKQFWKWPVIVSPQQNINNCNAVNGKSITVKGNNVAICNGRVFVDGIEVKPDKDSKFCITEIIVNSESVASVTADCGNITVNAPVHGKVTSDCGNITINGDITGDASTDCGNIKIKGQVRPPRQQPIADNKEIFGDKKTSYSRK